MKKHEIQKNHNDRLFILLGFVTIGILFLLYSRMHDFSNCIWLVPIPSTENDGKPK